MWILSGHGLVFWKCFFRMNYLIVSVNQCFIPHSYVATVTFLNLAWTGVFYAVKVRIGSYHTFSKYLFVWDRVLLNNHKTKCQSLLNLFQPPFPECQILCIENKHKSTTERLTGWNFLSFLIEEKFELDCIFLFRNILPLDSVICRFIWNYF